MAWSDAARAAALEARRMHATVKKTYGWHGAIAMGRTTKESIGKNDRVAFAQALRAMRKDSKALSPTVMRAAVSSTLFRNNARQTQAMSDYLSGVRSRRVADVVRMNRLVKPVSAASSDRYHQTMNRMAKENSLHLRKQRRK